MMFSITDLLEFPQLLLCLGTQILWHLYLYCHILISVNGSILHGHNALATKPDLASRLGSFRNAAHHSAT